MGNRECREKNNKTIQEFQKSCVCLFQNQILHIKEYIEPDCGFHIIPRSSNFLWRYHGLINKVYVTYYIEMILEGILQKDSTKKLQWCTFSTITLYLSFSETITVVLTFLFYFKTATVNWIQGPVTKNCVIHTYLKAQCLL